jgi:hypothetical protein
MSQPSNGITPEVIRDSMPPYELSPDLLNATFAAIPRPPPDATTEWSHARLARLTQEISTLMPANAAQARIAAQILVYRELADTAATIAHTPGVTVAEFCRLARSAAALAQTAATLGRSLTQYQQRPAPFFGTVLSDAVDLPAINAIWRGNADQPPAAPKAAVQRPPDPPNPSPPARPTPPSEALTPTEPQPQPDRPPHPAPDAPAPSAAAAPDAATPEWTRTPLDSGPGWSREVLRHRSSSAGGNGSVPGAAAQ